MIFAVVLPDELERRIFSLLQPAAVGRMLQVSRASRWRLQHKARWVVVLVRGCPGVRRVRVVATLRVLVGSGSRWEVSGWKW